MMTYIILACILIVYSIILLFFNYWSYCRVVLLTSIIIYLVITLLIGFWASRKVNNTKDFVVAGRQLPTYMAAAALFATWFGSETIMGASSEFVEHGLIGVIEDPFGAALCLILVGAFYARPLYRMNILTFNDFFKLPMRMLFQSRQSTT